MPAPTILCPSCGEENQRERSVCVKCYAPLHQGDTSHTQVTAAPAAKAIPRVAAAPVDPVQLLRDFVRGLREDALYNHVIMVVALIALIWAVFAAIRFNMLPYAYAHIAALGLLSIGMTAAVLTGGVDLSLGPVAAVGAAIALLSRPFGEVFALAVAVLAGMTIGFVNGMLVARKQRISSAIITLCTGTAAAALMLAYNVGDFTVEGFTSLQRLALGGAGGFPFSLLALVIMMALANILLNGVVVKPLQDGESLSTTSESEVVGAFTFGGITAGLSGVFLAASNMSPREIVFSAWYLMPLAAILIGGALLRERRATVPAAICGALILGSITSHLQTLGMMQVSFFVVAVAIVLFSSVDAYKSMSLAHAVASAKQNPWSAAKGAGGFCAVLLIAVGFSSDLISRVPANSAILLQSSGKLMYRVKGSDVWNEARGRVLFHDGDDLYTQNNSAALVKLSDDSVVKLASNTQLHLDQIDSTLSGHSATRLSLAAGRLYAKVKETVAGLNQFEVQTPTAVAAVRGTLWSVACTEAKDYVSVHKGEVEVASAGERVTVSSGNETTIPRNAPPSKPREMSQAEKSAWLREAPVLEKPLEQRLWESYLSSDFLHDNFDDGQIDPARWFLRAGAEGKDVFIRESGGWLSVGGVPPRRSGVASYGAITPSFPAGSCQASVDVRIKQGEGRAALRLADASGRGGSVAVVMDPQEGYDIVAVSAGRVVGRHVPAFGDERDIYHRLTLSYDAGARVVRGYVDEMSLGYVDTEFKDDARLEITYEGAHLREGMDCRFDNFETNIPVPRQQIVQTIVAAINPTLAGNSQTLLMAVPLSRKDSLGSVEVQYPRKSFAVATRLLVQSNGTGRLSRQRDSNVWLLSDNGSVPGLGDFIFRFRGTERQRWTTWQQLALSKFPSITNLRDGTQGSSIMAEWDPVPGADSYWVELIDATTRKSLFTSTLLGEPRAMFTPTRFPKKGKFWVTAIAHLATADSETSLADWHKAVALTYTFLAPEAGAFVSTKNPAGKDEFVLQCGQLRQL